MMKLHRMLVLSSMLAASTWTLPALAGDFSAGRAVALTETSRDVGATFAAKPSKGPAATRSADSGSRDLTDEKTLIRDFTLVGRSRDGTQRSLEPGPAVIDAIKGDKKAENDGKAAPSGAALRHFCTFFSHFPSTVGCCWR